VIALFIVTILAASQGRVEAEGFERFRPLTWDGGVIELLGMTLQETYAVLGIPKKVFPIRGEEAWQDDVVFDYDGLYVYWFENRVWQVSIDAGYDESVYGLVIGSSMDGVVTELGNPFHIGGSELIYLLRDRGYPVRVRLCFSEKRLTDVYIYRADF